MAAPRPIACAPKPVSTSSSIIVRVESSGPPGTRGMMYTWSKSLKARIVVTVITKIRPLRMPGRVTFMNCCQRLAPSMDAAS